MKTFKQLTHLDPRTLMIVDCLNMAFSFRGRNNYFDNYINKLYDFHSFRDSDIELYGFHDLFPSLA